MFRLRLAAPALLTVLVAACADTPSAPAAAEPLQPLAAAPAAEQVVPGEVLIQMKDGISLDVLTARAGGPRLERRLAEPSRVAVLAVAPGRERAEAARLAADPRVEYAEPNYIRNISAIDPRLWNFYNPGGLTAHFNTPPYNPLPPAYSSLTDADIDVVEGIAAGGAPVVIGSLDTGVDLPHPEFAGQLILGWDWVNNDAVPQDDHGHGTNVVGTMAGLTVGVAGVTGANVAVHVQKVCSNTGTCPTSAIVNAIYAAANYPGMVAINLSFAGASMSPAETAAINYAVNTMGVLVIAPAGNNGSGTLACPACSVNVIAVGATNWRDAKASSSQSGPGLDIVAPGGEIYTTTTDEMGIYTAAWPGGYKYTYGTSIAAGMVTGAAGVVASTTGLTGAALRSRLETTTDDKGAIGYDIVFGHGRLNVYRAITLTTLPYPL